jgi:hypothetical protein
LAYVLSRVSARAAAPAVVRNSRRFIQHLVAAKAS